jgi:hypothetical protein
VRRSVSTESGAGSATLLLGTGLDGSATGSTMSGSR